MLCIVLQPTTKGHQYRSLRAFSVVYRRMAVVGGTVLAVDSELSLRLAITPAGRFFVRLCRTSHKRSGVVNYPTKSYQNGVKPTLSVTLHSLSRGGGVKSR